MIASEPLTFEKRDWMAVRPNSLLVVTPKVISVRRHARDRPSHLLPPRSTYCRFPSWTSTMLHPRRMLGGPTTLSRPRGSAPLWSRYRMGRLLNEVMYNDDDELTNVE